MKVNGSHDRNFKLLHTHEIQMDPYRKSYKGIFIYFFVGKLPRIFSIEGVRIQTSNFSLRHVYNMLM
jgi:hypothetical protein